MRESRCTECGAALTLRIVTPGESRTAWLVLLTVSALLSGVWIPRWCAYLPRLSQVTSLWAAAPLHFVILDLLILASPVLLLVVIWQREWVVQWPAWVRWAVASFVLLTFAIECATLMR